MNKIPGNEKRESIEDRKKNGNKKMPWESVKAEYYISVC